MNNPVQDWEFTSYFKKSYQFVMYGLGKSAGGWESLAAFFFCVLFATGFIPVSILLFVLKNNFKVGVKTWALLVLMPIFVFLWMALA